MRGSIRPVAIVILLPLALLGPIGPADSSEAAGGTAGQTPSRASPAGLPKEKETTLGLYVTAWEAYEKWKAAPEQVRILDVRTTEEFIFVGHAAMAWNIPVVVQTHEWDPAKKHFAMTPNPEFVSRVKELFKSEDTILAICRSGGRGAAAVNLLAKSGFKNVYNVTDGMEGDMVEDPGNVFHGKRMKNGWKNSGLPWTYALDPEKMRLPAIPGAPPSTGP